MALRSSDLGAQGCLGVTVGAGVLLTAGIRCPSAGMWTTAGTGELDSESCLKGVPKDEEAAKLAFV